MIMEIKCPLCNKLLLTLEKTEIQQIDIDNHLQMITCECGNQNNTAEILQEENFMSENAKEYIQNFAPTSKPFTIWTLFKSPIFWLLVIALFFGVKAFATVNQQLTGTANATSTKVLNPNAVRNYLIIMNGGSQPIYAKFGSEHTSTEGVIIPASGNYEPSVVPIDSVYIKTATGSSSYNIVEGVK